jgi:hypothetical protein
VAASIPPIIAKTHSPELRKLKKTASVVNGSKGE